MLLFLRHSLEFPPWVTRQGARPTLFSVEALIRAHVAGTSDTTPFALGAYQRWYATQQMSPSGNKVASLPIHAPTRRRAVSSARNAQLSWRRLRCLAC